VIAPHGAGLTNVVFASAGAVVLEFLPSADVRPDYFQLSRSVGVKYGALICQSVNQRNDMQVDLEALNALLSELLA
jgi:capsular polysaccharide biosynthesis protein